MTVRPIAQGDMQPPAQHARATIARRLTRRQMSLRATILPDSTAALSAR